MSSGNNMTRVILGLILAGLSAALLTLSFPPYGLWPLAWVGFVPMIVAQYRILPEPISSLASAVGIGGFFWGYFGAAFRGAVWYMRWLPALIAIAVFFASSRDRRFHERTNYRFFLLQPAVVWVGIEFIRGSIPSVGTWGVLAYSQYTVLPVVQWASIVGVYGVSLFIVMANYGLGRAVLLVLDRHPVYTAGSEPRGKRADLLMLDRRPVCTAGSKPRGERATLLVFDRPRLLRSVETRVAVVKADFGFDSAIIDPYGRLISAKWSRTGERQVLVADVGLVMSPPPATYLGDWIGIASLLGMAVFIVLDLFGKAKLSRGWHDDNL